MGTGLLLALAAALTLLAVLCLLVLRQMASARRGNRQLVEEVAALRARLDRVEQGGSATRRETSSPRTGVDADEADYVITSAGLPALPPTTAEVEPTPPIDARRFASLAVGESLVRIVSLAYGVRRALSSEHRNRIGFEVKQEIRRSRRQRRRDLKEARRHLRAAQREDAA